MADEKKIVDLNVAPIPQIDREPEVVEEAPQPEPTTETPIVPEQPPIQTAPPVNVDVDEFGVPWKNRAMEYRRKNEEFVDKLPQIIDEKLKNYAQPATPQYTYEQLEAYKLQNSSDANIVAWATGEQRKMQVAENRKLFEEVIGGREKVAQEDNQKQSSLRYVQETFPDAFTMDANGRPIAWNEASPMTQTIRQIMQNPDFMNHPKGLAAAADIAYGRLARAQAPILQQKVQQAKADVKQAQKASLTEGAGRRVTVSTTPVQNSLEALRKSGSMTDATNAIGAILRQKGILSE